MVVLVALAWVAPRTAEAKNFELRGNNELCGGIGFAANFNEWTPGGFKWFNDYSRMLTRMTWLNFQFNLTAGDRGGQNCWRDNRGVVHCDNRYRWGGTAIEFAAGVKLKWRLKTIPLVFHAKLGGAFDILLFGYDYPGAGDLTGVAFGFRGGFGVRYFFLPTFGVGAELVPTFGPAFIEDPVGAEFYGAIDFNVGVEWRF